MKINIFELSIIFLFASCSANSMAGGTKEIGNERYQITIPSHWKSVEYEDDKDCLYLISGKENSNQSFTLLVCENFGNIEEIANNHGFEKIDGTWFRVGPLDENPAKSDRVQDKLILTGSATCGISNEQGFHAALGACYSVIILREEYGISFETDGSTQNTKEINKIIESTVINPPTHNHWRD